MPPFVATLIFSMLIWGCGCPLNSLKARLEVYHMPQNAAYASSYSVLIHGCILTSFI